MGESEVRFRSHIRQAGSGVLISATKESIFVRTWSPPAPPSATGNKVKEITLVESSKPALANEAGSVRSAPPAGTLEAASPHSSLPKTSKVRCSAIATLGLML